MSTEKDLRRAAEDGRLVRVHGETVGSGGVFGYVVATGPELFVLANVDEGARYDGYSCFRYADISNCEVTTPNSDVFETAMRLRGTPRPSVPQVDLATASSLIRTASHAYGLVTVHLEFADPGVCYIGRVREVSDDMARLSLITPNATWEEEDDCFSLSSITRIDFGGVYEEVLLLVAESR